MKKLPSVLLLAAWAFIALATPCAGQMRVVVDTAVVVPVNVFTLTDDTDFKTRETAVAYNAAGMDLVWNFVTTAGVQTQTAVTPTTSGVYDWAHLGDGMYSMEIPASGGASINNNTEGYGWWSGLATGVLPWRGPVINFVPANIANSLDNGTDLLQIDVQEFASLYGCNNQFDVGSGQVYATIAAAEAVAAAGDLIFVHPGTYGEILIGKEDITYYLSEGVVLSNSAGANQATFDGAINKMRVYGKGRVLSKADNNPIYVSSGTNPDVYFEFDQIDTSASTDGVVFASNDTDGRIVARIGRFLSVEDPTLAVVEGGTVLIEITQDAVTAGPVAYVSETGGVAHVIAKTLRCSNANLVHTSSDAGRIVFNGNFHATHASTNGINAPTGVTVIEQAGSLVTTTARPSLSGAGTHVVNDAFAFDQSEETASVILETTEQEIYDNLVNATTLEAGLNAIPSMANLMEVFDADGIGGPALFSTVGSTGANTLAWPAAWDAQVESEADDALVGRDLDKLLSVAVTNPDVVDNSVFAKLVSKSPTASWSSYNSQLGSHEALKDTLGVAGAGLTAIPWNTDAGASGWDVNVQSEVDDALRVHLLNKLFLEDYDPATDGGGVATAFLNEITANNSGVTRFTAEALALAPSGGGGTADWTADERTVIRAVLGIPGSGTTPADPTTGILDTIRDDTNELQVDWADGGRLEVFLDDVESGMLRPTTAGRTLDVSLDGEAGLDWANIGSPSSAQALSQTTIQGGGGGGVTATAVLSNTEIVETRVRKIATREDGTTTVELPFTMRVDDKFPIWIDMSPLLAPTQWIDDVQNVASSNPSQLAVASPAGINREMVVLRPDADNAVVGQSYTITCQVIPFTGELINVKATINVVND